MPVNFSSALFSQAPIASSLTLDEITSVREQIKPIAGSVDKLADVYKGKDALADYLLHYGFDEVLRQFDVEHSITLQSLTLPHGKVSETLVMHQWHQKNNAKANVCVFHGLFDHAGLYLPLIKYLLNSQFNVTMLEFPGHGLSSGKRAFITSFNDYAYCVHHALVCVRNASPVLPCYAVGQSTGGGILLNMQWPLLGRQSADIYNNATFDKLVLLSPLIYPVGWRTIKLGLLFLGRCLRTTPRKFNNNSHHLPFCRFVANRDPLQGRAVIITWTKAMSKWIAGCNSINAKIGNNEIDEYLTRNSEQLLVIQGGDDGTVDAKKNVKLLKRFFTQGHFMMVNGARHHLINESKKYRDRIFISMTGFLNSQD